MNRWADGFKDLAPVRHGWGRSDYDGKRQDPSGGGGRYRDGRALVRRVIRRVMCRGEIRVGQEWQKELRSGPHSVIEDRGAAVKERRSWMRLAVHEKKNKR